MKKVVFSFLFCLPTLVYAGGWTNTASINDIEIIRSQGFQVSGDFGNPSNCTVGNFVFVSSQHPQYGQLLSVALAAYMAGKKLKVYSHQCAEYNWHGGTFNELTAAGALYIKD